MNDYSVRPMKLSDVASLGLMVKKDRYSWSKSSIKNSIQSKNLCLVMENRYGLVGFSITLTVLDEAEILYLAIDRSKRCMGWGNRMLLDLMKRLRRMRVKSIFLEVSSSNKVAIKLYSRVGFNEIYRRKNYYNFLKTKEDAILMKFHKA